MESWKVEGSPRSLGHALGLVDGEAPERKPLAGEELACGGLPVPETLVRIRVLVDPPADGDYRFAIAGDDQARLEISEDGLPFHKRRGAWLDNYTGPFSWRNNPSQVSEVVRLTKGRSCYLELLCLNQGGGGHVEAVPESEHAGKLPQRSE